MKRLFGTDGIRGKAGKYPLDVATLERLGHALRSVLAPEALLIDLDGVLADVSRSYRTAIVATAAAGAVLRPTGSRMMAVGTVSICLSCSATRNRCSSLQTTTGAPRSSRPSSRRTVS